MPLGPQNQGQPVNRRGVWPVPARSSSSILAILFIIEVMINGSLLAKANIGGLLGGAVQAVSFAALNIIAS